MPLHFHFLLCALSEYFLFVTPPVHVLPLPHKLDWLLPTPPPTSVVSSHVCAD